MNCKQKHGLARLNVNTMRILEPSLTLNNFILKIKQVPTKQLKLAQLQDWVARLNLQHLAIAKHIYFSPENYQCRIIYRDSNCEIILVCWQPGQFRLARDRFLYTSAKYY